MTTWNPDEIARLCSESGRIALLHYDAPSTEYKNDNTVVTKADRGIEGYLEGSFDAPESGSYLIGEETIETRGEEYVASAMKADAWVVDPIDGTILYANHLAGWGISIGFMTRGRLTEGAVYFPLTKELYFTDRGKAYLSVVEPTGADHATASQARSLMPPVNRAYSLGGIIAITQEIARSAATRVANPVFAGGSAVYPLTELARSRMIGYIGHLKLWDFAGVLPILIAVGAQVSLDDGTPVTDVVDDSVYRVSERGAARWKTRGRLLVATSPEVHDYLRKSAAASRTEG